MRRTLPVLAAATIAMAGPAPSAQATSDATGTFSVLSYNVAGLPDGISSAPTPRAPATTAIGQRLAPYDVVHVQENFNYHANLYAADSHSFRTPTSGGAGIGSGLNTLSSLPYDSDDFERVRWNSCQFDSGDCLTPKGFTFMRLRLAEGLYVDTYNLHTNAGTSAGDLSSRADNLEQLSSFIASHSAGNAVIVMGDTNTRYTRAADTIRTFATRTGLTDAWVQVQRGGTPPVAGSDALVCDEQAVTNDCEVVDKILYRGNKLVNLTATSYNNEHAGFLNSAGVMLSDHDPIAVRFAWTHSSAYRLSDQFGGPHGDYFTDLDRTPESGRVTVLGIRAGSRVDQVSMTRADGVTISHGGNGGTAKALTLAIGEYPVSAYLCRGNYQGHTRIFFARFTTNTGNSLGGGTTTSDCTTYTAPPAWQIAGLHGRSSDEVDKLGLIFTAR